jgi:DNA invertase Pin-like site-specific DNA recombinase
MLVFISSYVTFKHAIERNYIMRTDRKTRGEVRRVIAEFIRNNPHLSYKELASRLGCSTSTIYLIAKEHGVCRGKHLDLDALEILADLTDREGK